MKFCFKYLVFIGIMFTGFFSLSQEKKQIAIYFEFDKYEITPKSKITLDSIISLANNSRGYSIVINAYTDSKGTDQYNNTLAYNRKKIVFDYFLLNQLNARRISYSHFTENLADVPDDLRRKAIINFEYIRPKTFYGKNGTEVIAGENDNLTISEYFSTKDMIRDSKFAIDENDQIIRSDGMFTICYGKATLDETGNFYIIKMPSRVGQVNPSMNVYLEITNENGQKRWRRTELKPEADETNKFYIFKIPIESKGCVTFNVDCPLPDNDKITFISTKESYDNVEVKDAENKLLFSAYSNKTGNQYVFLSGGIQTRNMVFYGYVDKKRTVMRLRDLNYDSEPAKDGVPAKEYYTPILAAGNHESHGREEKRGFWPWLRKVFTGKKTYITKDNDKQLTIN